MSSSGSGSSPVIGRGLSGPFCNAVQAALKARSPQWMPPRAVSGPTLLTGVCFCASCGGAMTLRTGKGIRYRNYTCSAKARMGETGCRGRTVPMDKLDRAVADHLEWRLLGPPRLATMLDQLLERREEWNERRRGHIAELRKLRNKDGTCRRDHLRALAQRVEGVDTSEIRIMESKTELLRTLSPLQA